MIVPALYKNNIMVFIDFALSFSPSWWIYEIKAIWKVKFMFGAWETLSRCTLKHIIFTLTWVVSFYVGS